MKRLDVSQLIELCRELGLDDEQELTQSLYATMDKLAAGAAEKLGVAACGVEYSNYGVLASFAPKAPGDACPALLEAFDDEGQWHEAPRRTLLFCDADADQIGLARRAVAGFGVTVIEARSADEAWEAYQENRVNLILADTDLPGLEGVDLMQKIVALEGSRGNRRKVPLITASADAGAGTDPDDGSHTGAVTRLQKPFDWERLGPMIGELCHAL